MDCRIVCKGMGFWDFPAAMTTGAFVLDSKAHLIEGPLVHLCRVQTPSTGVHSRVKLLGGVGANFQVNKTEAAKIPLLLELFMFTS